MFLLRLQRWGEDVLFELKRVRPRILFRLLGRRNHLLPSRLVHLLKLLFREELFGKKDLFEDEDGISFHARLQFFLRSVQGRVGDGVPPKPFCEGFYQDRPLLLFDVAVCFGKSGVALQDIHPVEAEVSHAVGLGCFSGKRS